jgi:hypothetical protein
VTDVVSFKSAAEGRHNMGSWSVESFGNDTACDWGYELEKVKDLSLVEATVQKALDMGENYLESSDAEEAIAAADVIARLMGNPGVRDAYTETVDKWVENHPLKPSQDLVARARRSIERILKEPSELLELWQEGDEIEAWKTSVENLKSRLKKAS